MVVCSIVYQCIILQYSYSILYHIIVLLTLLDLCASSLRRSHANLLCIVPSLTEDSRRESIMLYIYIYIHIYIYIYTHLHIYIYITYHVKSPPPSPPARRGPAPPAGEAS